MREVYLRQTRTLNPEDKDFAPGIAITHFPCEIGRHQSCDYQIDHPFISRRHCSFSLEGDEVWVRDLKSRNGTYLNGEPLADQHVLRDGDVLHLAHLRFAVRVSLPGAAPIAAGKIKASGPTREPHHVLVVEDNADAAETLALVLRKWGHEVDVAHDGPEAIQAAQNSQPDVVLVDICLPGIDGYQVARCLRQQLGLAKAQLVAISGYAQGEEPSRSREAGFDRLVNKPIALETLQDVLNQGH